MPRTPKPMTLGRAVDKLRDLHSTRETRLLAAVDKARERFQAAEKVRWEAVLEQLSDDDVKTLKTLLGAGDEDPEAGRRAANLQVRSG